MLNAKLLGLSGGILWGLGLFVFTLISYSTGYAEGFLQLFTFLYPGFSITVGGSFVGLIYGFVDAFIGLYLLALLYNWLEKKTQH